MRVYRKLDKPFALALGLFCLTLIIVFKSGHYIKLAVELTPNANTSQPILNSEKKLYKFKSDSKWKVLKDGTVIHLGNFSFSFNYSYLINNENICKRFLSKSLKVVIFVESEAIHFERRQVIRETWGLKLLQQFINYRIVFLIGLHRNTDTAALIQAIILFLLYK